MGNDDHPEFIQTAVGDRYRILGEAGRGGMATVYRARDERHDRDVAVKVLSREIAGAVAGERFLREIRVAAGLQHPHVVPLYDSGEAHGFLFYVMPFVEGGSLRARLDQVPPLDLDEVLAIVRDVGGALSWAHGRGVVHRDVKPENILLAGGVALVADFGVARALNEAGGEALTSAGVLLGTPTYLSPEQASASAPVDGRSDLYALACVTWEMLVGEPPFTGPTAWAVIARHHADPVPSLSERRPDLPESVAPALERALAKEPADRFPTVAAFLDALSGGARAPVSTRIPAPVVRNVPIPPSPIMGRDREREAVAALLERNEVRLVTLTGPGGTGKTRLAIELARDLTDRFPDGTCFVSLAPVSDPALVASAVASALGVRAVEGEALDSALLRALAPRRLLLVLDNFEQVIEGAPLLASLLEGAPEVKLLATSRTVLHLRGEHEFPVRPLELPDLGREASVETLADVPSVALFLERARAIRPDFRLDAETAFAVARICVRLDGLPLAIELAAARTRLLPPTLLLERLERSLDLLDGGSRDLPDRQRTLRATIDWSIGLLSVNERRVFQRFAVFAGGAPLEAAERVCRPEQGSEEAPAVLDSLGSLVDQSLLVQDLPPGEAPRLRMLQTIREYAAEALTHDGGEAGARADHLEWLLEIAHEAESQLGGRGQARLLSALELEHDNLRAALDACARPEGDASRGLELATAIWKFWLVRGHLQEGRSRLLRLLERAGPSASQVLRAKALSAVGMLGQNLGDYEAARVALAESLELWRESEDEHGVASGLTRLGWVHWRQCDYGEARKLSEKALALQRKLGNEEGEAHALTNLAWTALFEGDAEEAFGLFDRALGIRRAKGDRRGMAFALTMKGWSLLELGEGSKARALLDEAIEIYREVGERQLLAFAHTVLAWCLVDQGMHREAMLLARDGALAAFRSLGDRWGLALALFHLARAHEGIGEHDLARDLYRESLEVRLGIGDRHGAARCRERLRSLGEGIGDPQAM